MKSRALRNENNEIWELLKSNQEKEADAALGSSEVVKTQVKHNKVATLGKEKESCDEVPSSKDNSDEESYLPAEGKERKHDTLRQKFNLLNLDGPNKKQIESKIVLALYEVDAENYGFILADFVYKRLRSLYPILSSMIKHDEWTPSFCRRVAFYIDDYIQYKLPEDDNGITDIHSLALRIRDESSENVEEDVKKLKDLVNVWLNEFKNLKTKIRLCYIREKACDEINADDSVSAVSGVQIYGSRDDTKYSDEVPWMRYYATEKGLLGKRKEVLLNLHEEFERECAFIIEEYNISVLEPLSLKLSRHLGKKSVWERTDVEMLRKSGEVAISLLLFEDMDCNVKVFSEIDEVVVSVEEIREWVEYWVDNFKYVGDSDEELETITKSCD